jgi:hypothetical protein
MSPQILKPKSLSKKQLKMAKLYGCTALGHSLALRTAGLQWRALTTLYHTAGTDRFGLRLESLRKLNEEKEEE